VVISPTDCYTNRTKAVGDASIISLARLTCSMAIAGPIFAKSRLARQIFVNNSYTELNENMTEGLFSDERSLTDVRGHHTRRSSLFRKQLLRKRKVNVTTSLRTAQFPKRILLYFGTLGTRDKIQV
jgi:hypothetical protein